MCAALPKPRSRSYANDVAEAALARGVVSDEDVLTVIAFWYFRQNKQRRNVIPVSEAWVLSDTLGLVQSRDGQLVVTRQTRKHPKVLQLLSLWLRGRCPAGLRQHFPFTSVSLNYAYAVRGVCGCGCGRGCVGVGGGGGGGGDGGG